MTTEGIQNTFKRRVQDAGENRLLRVIMETYLIKIKELTEAKQEIDRLKTLGKRIVFTNGCFDILHIGHARYLYEARGLGDHLIVALNSDRSVRSIKGPDRPVIKQEERAEMLAALGCVDSVIIFDEDTPLKVIEILIPDILVKGGDWKPEDIIGSGAVLAAGGEVKSISFTEGSSTTGIINRIGAKNPQNDRGRPAIDRHLLDGFFRAVNEHNTDQMAVFFEEHAEFFFPKTQPLTGKSMILRFFKILFRQYPELYFKIERVIIEGSRAAVHWTNRGKCRNGDPYKNEGVTIFEEKDNMIVFISDFFKDTGKF